MEDKKLPTVKEYLDEKLQDMRFGVYQIDGEYDDVLYWVKQYCEMVIDEGVNRIQKSWPGMDIIRDSIDDIRELL